MGGSVEIVKRRDGVEEMAKSHDAFRRPRSGQLSISFVFSFSTIPYNSSHNVGLVSYLFFCEISESLGDLFAGQAHYCRRPRRMLAGGVERATETSACIPDASTDTKRDNDALQAQLHEFHYA